jgi:hypothetical protein
VTPGPDEALLTQPLARQVEEHQGLVVLERPVQQPGAERREVLGSGVTKPEVGLDLVEVVGAGVLAVAVVRQGFDGHAQLQREVGNYSGRRAAEIIGHEAQVRQGRELQAEAQTVVIAAAIADQVEIGV